MVMIIIGLTLAFFSLPAVEANDNVQRSSDTAIKFTPTDQAVSFNRTKQLIEFESVHPATIAESALAINATSDTGYAKPYSNSTSYKSGDFINVNSTVYRVMKGGISSTIGGGPSGKGNAITDGSMVVSYECPDQCNGKFPFFVSHKARAGAGHVWGGALDLILDTGYQGGFASGLEVDMTNNSGKDQPETNALFLTGIAGEHSIQNGLSIYSNSGRNFWSKTGLSIYGSRVAKDQAIYIKTGSTYGMIDEGSHLNGILLNGAYEGPALKTSGAVEASGYNVRNTKGVSCPPGTVNIATMEVTNGIVTHC